MADNGEQNPGRDFFIPIAWVKTSTAPAANNASNT